MHIFNVSQLKTKTQMVVIKRRFSNQSVQHNANAYYCVSAIRRMAVKIEYNQFHISCLVCMLTINGTFFPYEFTLSVIQMCRFGLFIDNELRVVLTHIEMV